MTNAALSKLVQAAGRSAQTQTEDLLGAPMAMELAIAVKFATKKIAKVPLPAQPPLMLALTGIIEGLALMATVTRASFTQVPLPKPLFPIPPEVLFPLPPFAAAELPVTMTFIQKQKLLLDQYAPVALTKQE